MTSLIDSSFIPVLSQVQSISGISLEESYRYDMDLYGNFGIEINTILDRSF